ncbi:hypothetical protein ZWY2020_051535 [Hordeum vulgare]|nr:hypothetical protein ZWY2020_051535 [Hordeum vulgare]
MKESSIQDIEFKSRVAVLFHAAATLLPVNLRLLVGECGYVDVGVPRFPRAASVEPQGLDIAFADPRISWLGFPTLERLSITSCRVNLTDLVLRCSNLRSFKLREDHGSQHMNTIIRSTSLEDLDVDTRIPCIHRFDIRAPALKRLAACPSSPPAGSSLETVSWRSSYSKEVSARLRLWRLWTVTLQTAENDGHLLPPHVNVMSLSVAANDSYQFQVSTGSQPYDGEIYCHAKP